MSSQRIQLQLNRPSRIAQQQAQRASRAVQRNLLAALLALLLALSLALNGCTLFEQGKQQGSRADTGAQSQIPDNQSLHAIAQDLFNYEVVLDTTTLNQLVASPKIMGIAPTEPTLGDLTLKSYLQDNDFYLPLLERLSQIDPDTLNESDLVNYEIIWQALEETLSLTRFFYYSEPLLPTMGVPSYYPIMMLEYSFRNSDDIDDYLDLLRDTPRYFDQIIYFQRIKAKKGLLMNQKCFDDVIKEIDTFLVEPVENNALIKYFKINLDSDKAPFNSLSDEQRASLQAANEQAVRNSVYPAFGKLRETLQGLKPLASPDASIATYPQGQEYYALAMERMGFSQTPEEAAALLDQRLQEYLNIVLETGAYNDDAIPLIPDLLSPFPAKQALEYLNLASLENFPSIEAFPYTIQETPEELPNDLTLAYYKIPAVDEPGDNQIYYYPDNVDDDLDYLSTLAHEGFPGICIKPTILPRPTHRQFALCWPALPTKRATPCMLRPWR